MRVEEFDTREKEKCRATGGVFMTGRFSQRGKIWASNGKTGQEEKLTGRRKRATDHEAVMPGVGPEGTSIKAAGRMLPPWHVSLRCENKSANTDQLYHSPYTCPDSRENEV